LLGAALTVSRMEGLPLAGRAMVADGRLEAELVFGSARGYGCAESRAVDDAVRAERLLGGMAGDVVVCK